MTDIPEDLSRSGVPRRRAAVPLRLLACIPVGGIYLLLRVMMRFLPPPARSVRDGRARAVGPPKRSASPIRWSVRLYRFSLVHDFMHKHGERCVYLPTCTEYAARVGQTRGLAEGLMLISDRFRRCRADTTDDVVDFP